MKDTADIAALLGAIAQPESVQLFRGRDWDKVVRQARPADLLARIGGGLVAQGLSGSVPEDPGRHLDSAMKLATRQHTELRHEVREIAHALAPTGVPLVLLKGAAYVMADLPAAVGRMVSDVDILVPRQRLAEVESALMMAGWLSTNRDAYDQRYYRTWMHELPPLKHMKRGTVLDVHHAILPLSARVRPDSDALLAHTLPVGGREDVRVLCPVDMVLHSAAHLFHEGELELGLRGLVDLDALLRAFAAHPDFWGALEARAGLLQLEWPLFLALRYTGLMLQTPCPPALPGALMRAAAHRKRLPSLRLMDALYLRALRPDHPLAADTWTPLARWLLYLRSHWIRMPAHLLCWHLTRKFITSLRPSRET
jgi:hypothetical protein